MIIGEDNVVLPTCNNVSGMYVSRLVFNFASSLSPGFEIWVYALRRNGTTNQFTPVASFLITSALLLLDGGLDGIRAVSLSSTALVVTPGDYIGIGMNSKGGQLFRTSLFSYFYYSVSDTGFSGLSTQNYVESSAGAPAFTADIKTY